MNQKNPYLIIGGLLSIAAAFMHLAIIFGGGDWYRFFGAGEELASMDEQGSWYPAILTLGIASVLFLWGLYAFSGAQTIRRLPFLRTALVIISAIYLLRGLAFLPAWVIQPELVTGFIIWSSLISLGFGLAYALGTWRAWPNIQPKTP